MNTRRSCASALFRRGTCLLVPRKIWSLILILSAPVMFSVYLHKAAAGSQAIQLVRLSVADAGGMVRIEIVADSSLSDVTVEQFGRQHETVVRIHPARSALLASYGALAPLAESIRTRVGQKDGEPFVDVVIATAEGAALAQRKSFNKLVIGVAADFASLRRGRAAETARVAAGRNPTVDATKTRNDGMHPAAGQPAPRGSSETLSARESLPAGWRRRHVTAVVQPAVSISNEGQTSEPSAGINVLRGESIRRTAFAARSAFLPRVEMFLPADGDDSGDMRNGPAISATTPFVLSPPGAPTGVWVPGTTAVDSNQAGGRPWHGGFLRPSLLFGGEYDSDFFYRSASGKGMGILTLAPRLEFEIPGETRNLRLAYEARLNRLTNGGWANGQMLDFDSRLGLGPRLRLAGRDHFARSALDSREFDPAGETYIVGDTFNRNDAGVRGEFKVDERNRVALDVGYNRVWWDDKTIATEPVFVNYGELSSAVSVERDMTERTAFAASLGVAATQASVPLRPQFDRLDNRRRYSFDMNLRHMFVNGGSLAARLGYEHSIFPNAPAANNFSGMTFDLAFRHNLRENIGLELSALRKTQVSIFNLEGGNARLISTGGAGRMTYRFGDALNGAFGVNYQRLGFPLPVVATSTASGGIRVGEFAGRRRADQLYGFSVEAGFRWTEILRSWLRYSYTRRDSNIRALTFNNNVFSLVFDLARRDDARASGF